MPGHRAFCLCNFSWAFNVGGVVCRLKHVEPSIIFGIINSITKLHLVGISTESSTMHGSMCIKMSVVNWQRESQKCRDETSGSGHCFTNPCHSF